MTEQQENHLLLIKQTFDILVDGKYRSGQREHGGNLFDKSVEVLLDEAIFEAIDSVVYLFTLKEKLVKEIR